jgi:hypothetical protein
MNRSPRFVLSLDILDLSNIPSPSGSCYVKWHIKDHSFISLKGKTKTAHIRDYRCTWGYHTQEFLKVGEKRDKTLRDKIVVLSVYKVPSSHSGHKHASHPRSNANSELKKKPTALISDLNQIHQELASPIEKSKTFLGRVEINLSEFVNYDEPKANRYLLRDSKINAVLNVKVGIEAVKGQNADYIAPPVKYKALSNVFNTDTASFPESGNSHHVASESKSQGSVSNQLCKSLAMSNDPVISKLYEQTFEISFDLRPGEYNVPESVEDIFNDGDGWAKNEDGIRLIDLQRERVKEELLTVGGANSANKGGANEFSVRGEMKSWQVSHV